MTHKLLLAALALVLSQAIFAQHQGFKIGIGYQRTRMLDEQASPLVYQSNAATFRTGYYSTNKHGQFTAELSGAMGSLLPAGMPPRYWYSTHYNNDGSSSQDSVPLTGKLFQGMINLGWMKDISSGNQASGKDGSSTRQFAGVSASNQLFYTDNMVRTGWMNSATVNADYQVTALRNTRHFFSVKICIPLFGVNTRLPYHNTVASPNGDSQAKTIFKEGSQFAWLGNFQNIRLEAGYEYGFSKNFSLGLRYFGQWLHYDREKPIRLYQNNLGIEANFK